MSTLPMRKAGMILKKSRPLYTGRQYRTLISSGNCKRQVHLFKRVEHSSTSLPQTNRLCGGLLGRVVPRYVQLDSRETVLGLIVWPLRDID